MNLPGVLALDYESFESSNKVNRALAIFGYELSPQPRKNEGEE